MKAKRRTIVITSHADIPAGYVPLAQYGVSTNGKKTEAYQAVHRAYITETLDAAKLYRGPRDHRGPVYVHRDQADAIAATATAPPAPAIPVFGNGNGPRGLFDDEPASTPTTPGLVWTAELQRAAVLGILNAAERIATALEDLAAMRTADAAMPSLARLDAAYDALATPRPGATATTHLEAVG